MYQYIHRKTRVVISPGIPSLEGDAPSSQSTLSLLVDVT